MNTQQKGIDILAGLGDGGLAAPVRLDAGVNPSCVVVADFNGDGLQDLAISGTDQALRIQLNTDGGLAGGGSFQALPAFDAGAVPSFLTAADLDFDDVADLIFTSNAANRLGVLLSERDGGFAPPQLFPTGNGPATVVAADVNGDGFLDLAVANTQDGTVGIYLNVCAPP